MTRKLISIVYSIFAACALAQQTPSLQAVRTRQFWNSIWLGRRPPGTKAAVAVSSTPGEACAGITLWRLRPSQSSDDPGVREEIKDSSEQWTAVRVAIGTPLAEGEKLRIRGESTRHGYMYLLDGDLLLFP